MKNEVRNEYRAAEDISRFLGSVHQSSETPTIDEYFQQCKRWQRRLEIANKRKWHSAARDSTDRLRGALDTLRLRTIQSIECLQRRSRSQVKPTTASIFKEILALRDEFESVTIDPGKQSLTAETSSIVLEGVHLGSFEIRLNWKYILHSSPYDIIAVDPNPASSGDGTTHPHVQSDSLCEGEGSDAIRRALDEGRIYDFFCVVDQVLRTYNSSSAYVQLEDWDGVCCKACGDSVDSNEACSCCKCETELCTDCSICCDSCADRFCTECVSSCETCHDDCCDYCMKSCDQCSEKYCPSCLNEGICDDCIERQNQTMETKATETQQSSSSIHTVCDGKVAVPA